MSVHLLDGLSSASSATKEDKSPSLCEELKNGNKPDYDTVPLQVDKERTDDFDTKWKLAGQPDNKFVDKVFLGHQEELMVNFEEDPFSERSLPAVLYYYDTTVWNTLQVRGEHLKVDIRQHVRNMTFLVDKCFILKCNEKNEFSEADIMREINFLKLFSGHKLFVEFYHYLKRQTTCLKSEHHLLMQYFPSKTLDEISFRLLTKCDLQFLMLQLGTAIMHMHQNNVLHLDVKGANIIVDRDLKIKLIDFNLSEWGPTATGARGTTGYIAPEVMSHAFFKVPPYFDGKADYYSLGCTLYRLVYGDCPCFMDHEVQREKDEERKGELCSKVTLDGRVFYPYVLEDACLMDLMTRLLEKDPARRLHGQDFLNHPYFEGKILNPMTMELQGKLSPLEPQRKRGRRFRQNKMPVGLV